MTHNNYLPWERCQICFVLTEAFYLSLDERICPECRYHRIPTQKLQKHYQQVLRRLPFIKNNNFLKSIIYTYLEAYIEKEKNFVYTLSLRILDST